MERKLTFNELMVLAAIKNSKINPSRPETWNKDPAFYRGLARIGRAVITSQGGMQEEDEIQFNFWERENDIVSFKKKIQETIEILREKGFLVAAC